DGIRDRNVTGVQTCALPIYGDWIVRVEPQNLGYAISYYSGNADNPATDGSTATPVRIVSANTVSNVNINPAPGGGAIRGRILRKIGRASCRERGKTKVVEAV